MKKLIGMSMILLAIMSTSIINNVEAEEDVYKVEPTPIPEESVSIHEAESVPDPIQAEIIEEVKEEPKKEYRYVYEAPITFELQQGIFDICEENGISFEFVMAVIAQESSYRANVTGDGGYSKGLMQIQERYHGDLMEELGVTDLYDPLQNVKVGVALLRSYFEEREDVYHVLMKYNGGARYANRMMEAGKVSEYAMEITERAIEYERDNGI